MKYSAIFIMITMIVLVLASCNFNYDEVNIADSLDETQPDIILENAQLVFVRGTKVTIYANRVEMYSKQQQQNMFDVVFQEKDRNEKVRMEGRADQVAIETENNNVTMIGSINARSHKDEAEITAEYLFWDDSEKSIEGSEISPVKIQKDIGSFISGYGFRADARRREFLLTGKAGGQLVVDEE